ncbi:MAG: WD40 repeat domain-containing protein, partial [Candidatus Acidiferrum sp.]
MITAGTDSTLKLWEVSTGLELRTLHPRFAAFAVAFSPDRRIFASDGVDGVILWDVQTGNQTRTLEAQSSQQTMAFSPDGRWLVLGQIDGTIVIWDVLHEFKRRTLVTHSGAIAAMVISADSQWLASSGDDETTAKVWNLTTGNLTRTLSGHTKKVTSISFSPDGHMIATASLDQSLRVWNPATGTQLRQLTSGWDDSDQGYLHVGVLFSVAFSPDGKSLLAGENIWNNYVWDAKSFELRTQFQSSSTLPNPTPFLPDGSAFIGLDEESLSPEIYDTNSGHSLLSFSAHGTRDAPNPKSLAFMPNGHSLLLGFVNSFDLWDLSLRNEPHRFHGSRPITNAAGTTLQYDTHGKISFWDVQKEKQLAATTELSNSVLRPGMSPDQHWIASCDSGTIHVRGMPKGPDRTLPNEEPECSGTQAFAFTSDSRGLAFGANQAVKLWQFADSGEVRSFKRAEQNLDIYDAVAFSPDGKSLAATRFQDGFCLFDVATGQLSKTFSTSFGNPINLVFTADGSRILASYDDARIRIWDVQSAEVLATMAVAESTGGWAVVDSKG